MPAIRAWLTLRANGLYLLTYNKPVITRVGNTDRLDAYAEPGDPLAVNNLCEWSAKHIWGVVNPEPLTPVRVGMVGDSEQVTGG